MIILKNAYLFTFNKDFSFGRYSILINNGKISDIADSTQSGLDKLRQWEEIHKDSAQITDCTNKIILPPFVNSCLRSESALIHYLLKRRHYENINDDLCIELIFNYLYNELPSEQVLLDLTNIYEYSFFKSLKSGILFLNEFSLRKDSNHLYPISKTINKTFQTISVCYPIKQDPNIIRDYKFLNPAVYITNENYLTVYDISAINELRSHNVTKLFLEVAVNKDVTEHFKQIFRKSLVSLLDEYGLIDNNSTFINPLYLDYNDMKILRERNANIIINPRDLNYFSSRYFPIDDYIGFGIKYSIGTGWLGEDLFKELRLFRNKYKELNISNIDLIKSITTTPYNLYLSNESDENFDYVIDVNKTATMILADLSDLRFQLMPEEFTFESICEFIIDNLTSLNISDIIIDGEFKVKNHKILNFNEEGLINEIIDVRKRLYKTGKYNEIKKKQITKQQTEQLDLKSRSDEEIKLFAENKEKENTLIDDTNIKIDEFRIKTKIPAFKTKKIPGQKSLFDEGEHSNIIQPDEYQDTPMLNLLQCDEDPLKNIDDEFIQTKAIDESIMKRLSSDKKPEKKTHTQYESKIELPKDVKLKFGDDE